MPELDKEIVVKSGRRLRIRPIWPDDADAIIDMGRRSTPDDLRMRFFSSVRPEPGALVTSLTDFDHERHIAVAAYDPVAPPGEDGFLGVVRLVCEPDDSRGEFAIMVRSDLKGHGLGRRLMREMLGWAVERGLPRVEGFVMAENQAMLRMVKACGGVCEHPDHDFQTVRVRFDPAAIAALDAAGPDPATDRGKAP